MLKKAQVIMLPTKSKSNLQLNKSGLRLSPISFIGKNHQHLYIISDDEIKKGDWYIYLKYNTIIQKKDALPLKDNCKKIIATTDTSLKYFINSNGDKSSHELTKSGYIEFLPQPSQQFIEKYIEAYNKGEVITDVLVEYEMKHTGWTEDQSEYTYDEFLKINPKDNTITIKKLKDNFNLNEIEKALFNTKLLTINEFNDIWKVMKKNLG